MNLTIELPEEVAAVLDGDAAAMEREVRLAVAIDWFRRGLISQGRAAELAGIARGAFFDELAARQIENVHLDLGELDRELGFA